MAKPGTKAYKEEYVHVVYGISRATNAVRSVWVRRDGVLSATAEDGTSIPHSIKPGWTAEREAALTFGLTDTFMVPVAMMDGDHTKRRLVELRELAAKRAKGKDS